MYLYTWTYWLSLYNNNNGNLSNAYPAAQCAGYTKPNLHNLKWAANRDLKWMIDTHTHLPLHSPSFPSHTHICGCTHAWTHTNTHHVTLYMHAHTHTQTSYTHHAIISLMWKTLSKKEPIRHTYTNMHTHVYTHIHKHVHPPPPPLHMHRKKQGKATQPNMSQYNPYNICKVYLVCFERQKQHVQVKPTFLWNLVIVATVQWCFKWQKFIWRNKTERKTCRSTKSICCFFYKLYNTE